MCTCVCLCDFSAVCGRFDSLLLLFIKVFALLVCDCFAVVFGCDQGERPRWKKPLKTDSNKTHLNLIQFVSCSS